MHESESETQRKLRQQCKGVAAMKKYAPPTHNMGSVVKKALVFLHLYAVWHTFVRFYLLHTNFYCVAGV